MSLIIAGERSGVGKTTITLALLAYLAQHHHRVQSFKVGPDYIDPMFHTRVTGRPCRNLDPVLTSPDYVKSCWLKHAQATDYTVIEGVMGLFDGIPWQGVGDYAATAHIARILKISVALVVDCARLSGSVAALVQGYRYFDAQVHLAGVFLNRVGSDRHLTLLQEALAPLHVPILGTLFRQDHLNLGDRHLGLVPVEELAHFRQYQERLATWAERCFDWSQLLTLLQTPRLLGSGLTAGPEVKNNFLPIAWARDRAFNFYYADNLDLLQDWGAQLIPFSPLEDAQLPAGVRGVWLGGGFPEVFAPALSQNHSLRQQLAHHIPQGLPVYAECGGLMYLCKALTDTQGQIHPMVGVIPHTCGWSSTLTLGYRQAIVQTQQGFIAPGRKLRGHEFHRSQILHLDAAIPKNPIFYLRGLGANSPSYPEGWWGYRCHASYLHLHFGELLALPQGFLNACRNFAPISSFP